MTKRESHFSRIAEFKERFRKLPTDKLRRRLKDFGHLLEKEAAIALRELLEECDEGGIEAERGGSTGPEGR